MLILSAGINALEMVLSNASFVFHRQQETPNILTKTRQLIWILGVRSIHSTNLVLAVAF